MKFASIACLLVFLSQFAFADLRKADSLFAIRDQGSTGAIANPAIAQAALAQYKLATALPNAPAAAWYGRLHCYSFLGTYTNYDKPARKRIFQESVQVADSALVKYPNEPDVLFWAAVQWARYAEEHGVLKVARKGVATKLQVMTNKLITVAPNYHRGGSWMLYSLVQAGTPRIPMFLEWPSKAEAEKGFRKALEIDPKRSLNLYLLGDFLFNEGRKEEAKPYLQDALRIPVDPKDRVEEAHYRAKVRELLAKI